MSEKIDNKKKAPGTRINHEIRSPQVRLIGNDGEFVGVVSSYEARQAAQAAGLDLVEVSPNAEPPVVRIMDYGKFKFEQKKKQVAAKKNQTRIKVKEIKFRPSTDIGDYEVKLRNLFSFLNDGDKVKVTVRFRGREIAHHELGFELIKRIQADVNEQAVVEYMPKMEGKQLMMILAPKPAKKQQQPQQATNAE